MTARREFILGAAGLVIAAPAFGETTDPWVRLRKGGLAVLMRHAATQPGLGDPPGFRLEDCATQRNLSEAGRAQARRVGERFRAERVVVAKVYTSPWCRCRETAMLAFGIAEDWDPLSSIFDRAQDEPEYTERVKKRIAQAGRREKGVVVMVTHNVNIAAVAGASVAEAELVLMRPDGCCGARTIERLKIAQSSGDRSHFS
jgi:broad specificity phosphatase PhoE